VRQVKRKAPILFEDSDSEEEDFIPTKIVSKKTANSSRYSMMPLHTEPVLKKGERLTGDRQGKHSKFLRSKGKNVDKKDADTQTTPSLAKKSRKRT